MNATSPAISSYNTAANRFFLHSMKAPDMGLACYTGASATQLYKGLGLTAVLTMVSQGPCSLLLLSDKNLRCPTCRYTTSSPSCGTYTPGVRQLTYVHCMNNSHTQLLHQCFGTTLCLGTCDQHFELVKACQKACSRNASCVYLQLQSVCTIKTLHAVSSTWQRSLHAACLQRQ